MDDYTPFRICTIDYDTLASIPYHVENTNLDYHHTTPLDTLCGLIMCTLHVSSCGSRTFEVELETGNMSTCIEEARPRPTDW